MPERLRSDGQQKGILSTGFLIPGEHVLTQPISKKAVDKEAVRLEDEERAQANHERLWLHLDCMLDDYNERLVAFALKPNAGIVSEANSKRGTPFDKHIARQRRIVRSWESPSYEGDILQKSRFEYLLRKPPLKKASVFVQEHEVECANILSEGDVGASGLFFYYLQYYDVYSPCILQRYVLSVHDKGMLEQLFGSDSTVAAVTGATGVMRMEFNREKREVEWSLRGSKYKFNPAAGEDGGFVGPTKNDPVVSSNAFLQVLQELLLISEKTLY